MEEVPQSSVVVLMGKALALMVVAALGMLPLVVFCAVTTGCCGY